MAGDKDGRRNSTPWTSFTLREADIIAGIRRVAPDLPAIETYRLARFYIAQAQRKAPTADLQEWLAFGPWRGGPSRESYEEAVANGLTRARIDQSPPELVAAVNTVFVAHLKQRLVELHPEWGMPLEAAPDDAQVDPALLEFVVDAAAAWFESKVLPELKSQGPE